MAASSTLETLKTLKVFQGIEPSHLEKLAPLCEVVSFAAGTDIFRQYDKASAVYAIVEGHVSLVLCDEKVSCRRIGQAGPGEIVGWSPLVGRSRLLDTAHADTAVTAVRMDGDKLVEFCDSDPEFGYAFMRRTAETLAERLSGARVQLLEVHGLNLPQVQIESD